MRVKKINKRPRALNIMPSYIFVYAKHVNQFYAKIRINLFCIRNGYYYVNLRVQQFSTTACTYIYIYITETIIYNLIGTIL